jgi:2-polyprenyl-6-methoxyphenol hydroxylase-like FAD-dependent oxidoreductase
MPELQEVTVGIMGAGLAGLVLALALKTRLNVAAQVFEQAPEFGINA